MNFPDIVFPNLGLLRYSNQDDWYDGQINFQQLQVSITLHMDDEGLTEALFNRANHLVINIENYAASAKDYAVEKMLELKNKIWVDENEEPLTSKQFKNFMVLDGITIYPEGNVEFYHDDGDLFFGHCIVVNMDGSDRFLNAYIAG